LARTGSISRKQFPVNLRVPNSKFREFAIHLEIGGWSFGLTPPKTGRGEDSVGAIVVFLLWLTADFIFYGYTNLSTLTKAIVDPILDLVHAGIAGAVVAAVLKKVPASSPKPA
jgi:hypothetical protein